MIVFAAITPHPPLLIPEIGKDNIDKIKNTEKSMRDLEQEFYASKPEVIIVFSPHSIMFKDRLAINVFPEYEANFEDFGDFSTKQNYSGAPAFIEKIRMALEPEGIVSLYSEQKIDHGVSVPLHYLTKHVKNIKIIPIGCAQTDYGTHFNYGKRLKRELFHINQRIAVIASGDLSHRLTKEAPAGYSPSGQKFDTQLVDLLKEKNIEGILKINKKLINEAGECGLRSIAAVLGVINDMNFEPEVLSYEGPFGVGYLVCNLKLK